MQSKIHFVVRAEVRSEIRSEYAALMNLPLQQSCELRRAIRQVCKLLKQGQLGALGLL